MSQLQPYIPPSLTAAERDCALLAITSMLEGFPQRTADAAGMARAFVVAVDDLTIEAIEVTAMAFARGKVEGRNNAFPPSTAEFCAEAWRYQHRQWREAERSAKRDLRKADEITAERHARREENARWREQFERDDPEAAARVLAGSAFDLFLTKRQIDATEETKET